jgi:hypothetical protein
MEIMNVGWKQINKTTSRIKRNAFKAKVISKTGFVSQEMSFSIACRSTIAS